MDIYQVTILFIFLTLVIFRQILEKRLDSKRQFRRLHKRSLHTN